MEKVKRNMVPYSVYLPKDYHDKISALAKKRQASGVIRDAICMILDGGDQYKAGYTKGIRDAIKAVTKIPELQIIAYKGKYMDTFVLDNLEQLEL